MKHRILLSRLQSLNSARPNGHVLFISSTQLFVSGESDISGVNANGFAIYDLVNGSRESGIWSLRAANGGATILVWALAG